MEIGNSSHHKEWGGEWGHGFDRKIEHVMFINNWSYTANKTFKQQLTWSIIKATTY